jgi:hypothetical protein
LALGAATILALGLTFVPIHAALAANGAAAAFTKSSDWGTGYEGKYTITNGSTSPLDWRVEFDLPTGATISSFWDASVTKTGNHVVAVGTWNMTLAVGTSTSFGWIGAPRRDRAVELSSQRSELRRRRRGRHRPANDSDKPHQPEQDNDLNLLSWSASTDTGGSGLAGYNVYRNGSATPTAQSPAPRSPTPG